MNSKRQWILYNGQEMLPAPAITLKAGDLTMRYEASGDLRSIKFGEHEVLRRIYVAVRDPNWNTIPAQISVEDLSIQANAFSIRYRAAHHQDAIHFTWQGTILGGADSSLTFLMDGAAQSSFLRNRIGFCVLHPMSCAGMRCSIEHVDGSVTERVFPVEIAPHQPFRNMRAISHEISNGRQAVVRFGGEIFEMEDQRNWTDASYKTYGTPLDLPIPVEVAAGTTIEQSVTLRLIGDAQPLPNAPGTTLRFTVTDKVAGKLPAIGLSSADHEQPLTDREVERLRLLRLAHLRADVHFRLADWRERFAQTMDEAHRLNVALEVALHLTATPETDLAALRQLLDTQKPKIAVWLLFQDGHNTTPDGIAALARQRLVSYDVSARFAGGTDAFFAQLNRERPALDGLDLLTYSMNPQVHAFDDASLIENLAAQAVTVASAGSFSDGRGVMISPVTLKLRYNPAATRPPDDPRPGELPAQVDVRQMSLLGAGWTLGSLKYLSEGGAERITYYQTTGWLGVMECENLPARSAPFPAHPSEVFPLFHVLADVGEFADAEVLRAWSSDPLTIDGLALRLGERVRVLLANFTSAVQHIDLRGLHGEVTVRRLNEHNAELATQSPEIFRTQAGERFALEHDHLQLELAPYAVAKLDMRMITR